MRKINYTTLFKGIVGSQAYGTSTPQSDIDYKGVYLQPIDDLIGFGYVEQFQNNKDDVMYEIRRFLELAKTANPTILEMLYLPSEYVVEKHPAFDIITKNRNLFLTKKCVNSFGGYAISQIKKASALDKKMNWESNRVTKKSLINFCYVYENGKSIPMTTYLVSNGITLDKCGAISIDHMKDCYAIYYDYESRLGYKGLFSKDNNSIVLSSIPKGHWPICIMSCNLDAFSIYHKEYSSYQTWLTERNEARYVDTKHGQKIDGKNLMHCRRLLDMAMEIAKSGTFTVRSKNIEHLIEIRKGKVDLKDIIDKANDDIILLDSLYEKSDLPEDVDSEKVNRLLLDVRYALM